MEVSFNGAKVKAMRRERGLLASFVATKVGMSQSEYSNYEAGKRGAKSLDKIFKIARFYNVPIEELLVTTLSR